MDDRFSVSSRRESQALRHQKRRNSRLSLIRTEEELDDVIEFDMRKKPFVIIFSLWENLWPIFTQILQLFVIPFVLNLVFIVFPYNFRYGNGPTYEQIDDRQVPNASYLSFMITNVIYYCYAYSIWAVVFDYVVPGCPLVISITFAVWNFLWIFLVTLIIYLVDDLRKTKLSFSIMGGIETIGGFIFLIIYSTFIAFRMCLYKILRPKKKRIKRLKRWSTIFMYCVTWSCCHYLCCFWYYHFIEEEEIIDDDDDMNDESGRRMSKDDDVYVLFQDKDFVVDQENVNVHSEIDMEEIPQPHEKLVKKGSEKEETENIFDDDDNDNENNNIIAIQPSEELRDQEKEEKESTQHIHTENKNINFDSIRSPEDRFTLNNIPSEDQEFIKPDPNKMIDLNNISSSDPQQHFIIPEEVEGKYEKSRFPLHIILRVFGMIVYKLLVFALWISLQYFSFFWIGLLRESNKAVFLVFLYHLYNFVMKILFKVASSLISKEESPEMEFFHIFTINFFFDLFYRFLFINISNLEQFFMMSVTSLVLQVISYPISSLKCVYYVYAFIRKIVLYSCCCFGCFGNRKIIEYDKKFTYDVYIRDMAVDYYLNYLSKYVTLAFFILVMPIMRYIPYNYQFFPIYSDLCTEKFEWVIGEMLFLFYIDVLVDCALQMVLKITTGKWIFHLGRKLTVNIPSYRFLYAIFILHFLNDITLAVIAPEYHLNSGFV